MSISLKYLSPPAAHSAARKGCVSPRIGGVTLVSRPLCSIHSIVVPELARRHQVVALADAAPVSSTVSETVEAPGIHSVGELGTILQKYPKKLVVVMCKSKHCKPCKAFMPTYISLSERFADAVFYQMVGDESPELRAIMKEWQVKATPTFRMYRDGAVVETTSGTGNNKLLNALLGQVKDGERGVDWIENTHETMD